MVKKLLCLLMCLLIPCAALAESPDVADVMAQVVAMSPEDRASLAEAMQYYMSLIGEEMPQPESFFPEKEAKENMLRKLEHAGFSTPEEAVEYYLEGLKNNDWQQMLSAFAIESYVEHVDLAAMLTMQGFWDHQMSPVVPHESRIQQAINLENRRHRVANWHLWMLVGDAAEGRANIVWGRKSEVMEKFQAGIADDPLQLMKTMTQVQVFEPNKEYVGGQERYQKQSEKSHAMYQADEVRAMAATFMAAGEMYWFHCDAVCYDGRWHLLQLPGVYGIMIGLNSSGSNALITDREYRTEYIE